MKISSTNWSKIQDYRPPKTFCEIYNLYKKINILNIEKIVPVFYGDWYHCSCASMYFGTDFEYYNSLKITDMPICNASSWAGC